VPTINALIARGKLPKVALVATMRKLLHAAYTVATRAALSYPKLAAQEVRQRRKYLTAVTSAHHQIASVWTVMRSLGNALTATRKLPAGA